MILGIPSEMWIADQREQGCSWRTIARNMADCTSGRVNVTERTLQNWMRSAEAA
jgi:hypothetical protein